jgi:preprotein translocase subunit SecB
MSEASPTTLRIDQIFLEKAQFDHGEQALQNPANTRVELPIDIQITTAVANDGRAGLIRVRVSSGDEKALYRFDISVLGLVQVEAEGQQAVLEKYLQRDATFMIYPFVREALANLTGKGRFGAIWLRPLPAGELVGGKAVPESG